MTPRNAFANLRRLPWKDDIDMTSDVGFALLIAILTTALLLLFAAHKYLAF